MNAKSQRRRTKGAGSKINVPSKVSDTLIEFTMTYLLELPNSFDTHAKNFFNIVEKTKHTPIALEPSVSQEFSTYPSDISVLKKPKERRQVVFSEAFTPTVEGDVFVKPVYQKTEEELKTLGNVIKQTFLFRALDAEQLQDIINAMFKIDTHPGDTIINQGDDGDNFYVIESGIYDVYQAKPGARRKYIHSYENSGNFGELALLYNQPRAATVIAKSEGIIWALDRATFRKLVMQTGSEKKQFYEQFIKSVPIVAHVGSYERYNIADALGPRSFLKGEVIYKQGDEADGIYFIIRGSVSIKIVNKKGQILELDHVAKYGYFGEIELIEGITRRVTSAYADADARLAFLDRESFERFMGPCQNAMKLRSANYKLRLGRIPGFSKHNLLYPDLVSIRSGSRSSESSLNPFENPECQEESYVEAFEDTEKDNLLIKIVHAKTREERTTLTAIAKSILLFRALDDEQLEDVINAMFKRETKPGDVIIRQGDDGDHFYIIERGVFQALVGKPGAKQELVCTYEDNGQFGELALLNNQPRAATIVAKSNGVLWGLDRRTFRNLVMRSAYEKRMNYLNLMKTIPVFRNMKLFEKLNIADVLEPRTFKEGEVIYRQGRKGDGMYFVEKGSVSFRVKIRLGGEVELETIGVGGYFGHLSVLTNKPRLGTVYALEDTRLAFLDNDAFERFMGPCVDELRRTLDNYKLQMHRYMGSRLLLPSRTALSKISIL